MLKQHNYIGVLGSADCSDLAYRVESGSYKVIVYTGIKAENKQLVAGSATFTPLARSLQFMAAVQRFDLRSLLLLT
jgi:hypothetical protein